MAKSCRRKSPYKRCPNGKRRVGKTCRTVKKSDKRPARKSACKIGGGNGEGANIDDDDIFYTTANGSRVMKDEVYEERYHPKAAAAAKAAKNKKSGYFPNPFRLFGKSKDSNLDNNSDQEDGGHEND
jgi:hypothetical protein